MSTSAAVGKLSDATTVMAELLTELQSVAETTGRTDLVRRLTAAGKRIADNRLRIIVTGESRSGISSLVNALVSADACPVGQHTTNSATVEHGDTFRTQRRGPDVTVAVPAPLLAEGVVLVDTPGITEPDSRTAVTTVELLPTADAVLFVADATSTFSSGQLLYLRQLQSGCPVVACVLNKIDRNAQWADIQKADRALLDEAGLDLPLLPVSTDMHRTGHREGDAERIVGSGIPQLTDYIRTYLVARAGMLARESVIHDVRVVSDQVVQVLNAELTRLQDQKQGMAPRVQLEQARQAAEALSKRIASWQYVLGDGVTELNVAVDHDLRNRLRALIRDAEHDLAKTDPARKWTAFGNQLDERIATEVAQNFRLAHRLSLELATKVAVRFGEDQRRMLPPLRIDATEGVLRGCGQLEELDSAKGTALQRTVSALRGSYSGVLMIGVATTLAGLALVNPWSIAAGVLLGAHTVWEDFKGVKTRRQLEAKVAVGKLMDEVSFQVGKESKQRLREVQRTLRDHFTEVEQRCRLAADEAINAAARGLDVQDHGRRDRIAGIAADMERLQRIRVRAAALLAPAG